MEQQPERRSSHRVIVGPDHTVRFQVRGHGFRDVRITNISSTGCFAMVSQHDSALFTQGAILEQFTFEHPDLPLGPLTAQVMYLLGGANEGSSLDFMGIGIHFVGLDDHANGILETFLDRVLKP